MYASDFEGPGIEIHRLDAEILRHPSEMGVAYRPILFCPPL